MVKGIRQIIGFISIFVGACYLLWIVFLFVTDRLSVEFLGQSIDSDISPVAALLLNLPLPFHMVSVGFAIQRRWLPSVWKGTIRWSTVSSGCLLGASLVIRYLLLN